jgi:hypothetical protein
MLLRDYILERLAEMVIGDHKAFPYKSSSYITRFFGRCGFNYVHDGTTRKWWTKEVLHKLGCGTCSTSDLPSDDLLIIVAELFDSDDFDRAELSRDVALGELNNTLSKQGLVAFFDADGRCQLRNTGTGSQSISARKSARPLSKEEVEARSRVADYLDRASEDEFTEKVLVPLFQRLGFARVSAVGHREKALEFGKDLWMKYQLPTGHWLYFCAQIKRDKIDASGNSGSGNVATVLNQAKMAIGHAIFDPDANRKVLLDHIYIISAAEITRAARAWIAERLDTEQRRHIIFMDRDEFLDHAARILLDLRGADQRSQTGDHSVSF